MKSKLPSRGSTKNTDLAVDLAVAKSMCEEDLLFFTRYFFKKRRNFKFKLNWHHRVIADALMRVYRGETKRLIINLPPRYTKTELAVINFVAWCYAKNPDCEFIHTTYAAKLAIGNSAKTRDLIKHEAYQEMFPDVRLSGDASAKEEWHTTDGGVFYATGSEGTITGFGAGKMREGFGGAIIIDDPHKASEANSDTMRENVIEWFQDTLESRTNNPDTPIILVMQRLHESDLAGWLLAGGNGEEWEHICIPAISDDGEVLWPWKHDIDRLRLMEQKNRYVFSGQYMQRPSPKGGNIIKGDWFPRYKVVPPLLWRAAYVDTAQKANQHNDYTVFTHAGKGIDGRIYILDLVRKKVDAVGLEKLAKDLYAKWKVTDVVTPIPFRYFAIEDKASGTGLIQQLQGRHRIPVKPIQRGAGQDKYSRVMDIQAHLESLFVCIPDEAPWVVDFIAEGEGFTANDTHAFDDQVDTLTDCVNDMLGNEISMLDAL